FTFLVKILAGFFEIKDCEYQTCHKTECGNNHTRSDIAEFYCYPSIRKTCYNRILKYLSVTKRQYRISKCQPKSHDYCQQSAVQLKLIKQTDQRRNKYRNKCNMHRH